MVKTFPWKWEKYYSEEIINNRISWQNYSIVKLYMSFNLNIERSKKNAVCFDVQAITITNIGDNGLTPF